MDDFRTVIDIPISSEKISHTDKILLIGSCFSENIGHFFKNNKFKAISNPFGVLYNPASIKEALTNIMQNKMLHKIDLHCSNGLYFSFSHHSSFSCADQAEALNKINTSIQHAHAVLKDAGWLIITFGTAWVYKLKSTGNIVANCHKEPANNFVRERLSVHAITKEYHDLIESLKAINPNLKIIFTLSPVRHWKDGAVENHLSKSILMMAIQSLAESYNHVQYFPSYEIMMDELRDYRFYNEDMLHPSDVAVKYIWKRFMPVYFSNQTLQIIKDVQKIQTAYNHRIMNPGSAEIKKFAARTIEQIKKMQAQIQGIDFDQEMERFNRLLQVG